MSPESLIPPNLDSAEERRRARVIVWSGLGLGAGSVLLATLAWYGVNWSVGLYILASGVLITASPLIMSRAQSVARGGRALVVGLLVMFGGTALLLGGLRAPSTPVLTVIPIIGLFLLGRDAGWFLSYLTGAVLVVLLTLELLDIQVGYVDPSAPALVTFLAIGLVAAVFANLVFAVQSRLARQDALIAITRSHERMLAMIEHLDATSSALSRSAVAFSGDAAAIIRTWDAPPSDARRASSEPGGAGIARQMLDTADASRKMIDSLANSIRSMVEQYQQITQTLSSLTNISSRTSNVVLSINKISARLDFMALNTSLEAARAGESGKGFLLLADDMRRLAVQVLGQTAQIKETLRDSQMRTQQVIDAVAAGQTLTDEGIAKLDAMSQTFNDMHGLIEYAAEASRQMTHETLAQLMTIHNLVDAAHDTRAHKHTGS